MSISSVGDSFFSLDRINISHSQEEILFQTMQTVPNNPFHRLAREDIWKLLFMERDKIGDGKDCNEQEEPGYLSGVMNGYHFMLKTLGTALSADFYEALHDACVEGIRTKEYPNGIPKGYRQYADGAEAFHLVPGVTVTQEGIDELKERVKNYRYFDVETKEYFYPLKEALDSPSKISLDKNCMIKLKPVRPETCRRNAKFCMDLYEGLPKNTEEEKLVAIATICQDLDQFHLFVDGNIRTLGIPLLNKLLLEQNLEPCIMKDVNQLDALSRSQIVALIKEGQQYFRELVAP